VTQWLYRLDPVRPEMVADATDEERAIVAEHLDYLRRLAGAGVVLLAGRTTGEPVSDVHGVVVLDADDEAAAHAVMAADPAVVHGVMRATLHPFRLAVTREGWGLE